MGGYRAAWIAGLVAILLFPAQIRGVELEETIWDFGDASPGDQIGLVSVLLRNDAPEPFEAPVELSPSFRGLGSSGTVLVEQVFIAPNSSRWVQFYPYRPSHMVEWVITCGRRERFDLPAVKTISTYTNNETAKRPMVAWLVGDNQASSARGAVPTFPAELFPATVTATNGLHVAILNEDPRWDQPRRVAFLQWLHRGGILHLYHGVDGAFPTFGGELAVLNNDSPTQQVGQGNIIRHAQSIGGVKLADIVPDRPKVEKSAQEIEQMRYNNYGYVSYFSNDEIFRRLRELVAPQHQWPLIWLASIVYLLLIFPGGYLLGRAKRDFRLVMGLQIGSALLFTVLFSIIGARGYNETSRNLGIGVARPVGSNQWELASWNNVFATSGGDYSISFPKSGGIFATGVDSGQSLRGLINNGAEGKYLVDIPPYSSCTFLSQSIIEQPGIDMQITNWDPENPRRLECQVNSGWPADASRAFVYYDKIFYTMTHDSGKLTVLQTTSPNDNQHSFRPWGGRFDRQDPEEDSAVWLNRRLLELEQEIASTIGPRRIQNGERIDDKAIVLIPAPMPETAYPNSGVTGKPAGRILYCLDLKVPGK